MMHTTRHPSEAKRVMWTHAFSARTDEATSETSYNFNDAIGVLAPQVLGRTWVNHWSYRGKPNTRGVIERS